MRNLFLMSLFGLFLMAATAGSSLSDFTLISSAFASAEDDKKAASLAQDEAVKAQQEADQAKADADKMEQAATEAAAKAQELGSEEAKKEAEKAKEEADKAAELAKQDLEKAKAAAKAAEDAKDLANKFHCPPGIISCYSANGDLGVADLNSLPPSASGGNGGGVVSVIKPSHFRSF